MSIWFKAMHKRKLPSLFCAVKLIIKFSSPAFFQPLQWLRGQMSAHGYRKTKYCNKQSTVIKLLRPFLWWIDICSSSLLYLPPLPTKSHISQSHLLHFFTISFSLHCRRWDLRAPKELPAENTLSARKKAKFYLIKKPIPSAVLGTSNWKKFLQGKRLFKKRAPNCIIN